MDIPIPPLTIPILDAIQFTADAWNRVEASTIASCWMRTGIIPPLPDSIDKFLHLPPDTEDDEYNVQCLINRLHPEDPLTASEYLEIDSALQIEDRLDDDVIVSLVQGIEAVEEEEEALETATAKVTSAEAVNLIDKLMDF